MTALEEYGRLQRETAQLLAQWRADPEIDEEMEEEIEANIQQLFLLRRFLTMQRVSTGNFEKTAQLASRQGLIAF